MPGLKRNIAVISDLHIGPSGRMPDFNPFSTPRGSTDEFKREFERFVTSTNCKADMLIVPGDVTDRGHPDEYKRAEQLIKFVADCLSVDEDRIIIGLGNHDCSWALSQAIADDTTGLRQKVKFLPILDNAWFANKTQTGGSLTSEPFFTIRELKDTYLVCYNSACWDDFDNKPHHGIAVEEHMIQLAKAIKNNPSASLVPRICITHHHPLNYSDPRPNQPDFSAMTNAERFLDVLRNASFDLLIHGHKHSPRFGVHQINNSLPLGILCAGSFSRDLDSSWTGVVANQFHMIEIDGRDASSGQLFGAVRSWALRLGSWEESNRKYQGMPHISSFGYTLSADDVVARFTHALRPTLDARGYLEPSDFLTAEPKLKYAFAPWYVQVLRRLAIEWGCILNGVEDEFSPPKSFMLVRKV